MLKIIILCIATITTIHLQASERLQPPSVMFDEKANTTIYFGLSPKDIQTKQQYWHTISGNVEKNEKEMWDEKGITENVLAFNIKERDRRRWDKINSKNNENVLCLQNRVASLQAELKGNTDYYSAMIKRDAQSFEQNEATIKSHNETIQKQEEVIKQLKTDNMYYKTKAFVFAASFVTLVGLTYINTCVPKEDI